MDKEPTQNRKILSYEQALALAKADGGGWNDAQIWTLEDYLVRRSGEQLIPQNRDALHQRLRRLGPYTVKNLTSLGNEYGLLPDFDLETESLKVYCRRNNFELIG